MSYDVIVLGGGPGGYMAAEKAGHAGLKTLLIEKEYLGGVCLNEGCIPTKTLLYSAKIYDYCNGHGAAYGVTCSAPKIDHPAVIKRKNRVVKALVSGVAAQMKANHVEVIWGVGTVRGKTGDGFVVEVDGTQYAGKNLILAAGASTTIPPFPGAAEALASGFALTSREILDLEVVPASLAVIGVGVVAVELASYFNSVGSQVTVFGRRDRIARETDKDIANLLQKNYEKKGMNFILSAGNFEIGPDYVQFQKDGQAYRLPSAKVLLALGRKPNTQGIGLETLGVAIDGGSVACDSSCRTNVPGVYCIGDMNGKLMLAHTAYREADCAVNTILGKADEVDYNCIPSVIYTNPEVGSVGEIEESAKAKGYDVEVIRLPMQYSGRYMAENEGGNGICKLLFDRKTKTMIGAHALANPVSEFIADCGHLMALKVTVGQMKRLVFPHPTTGEILRDAIHMSKLDD